MDAQYETTGTSTDRSFDIRDLVDAYAALEFLVAGCWRGVHAGVLASDVTPRASLCLTGELSRNIAGPLAENRDAVEFEWTTPGAQRVLAVDELSRMLSVRDEIADRGLSRDWTESAVETLTEIFFIPEAVAEAAAYTVFSDSQIDVETACTDDVSRPTQPAQAPALPVEPIVHMHEWLAEVNCCIWAAKTAGRLSRALAMPTSTLESILEVSYELRLQVGSAVHAGRDTIRLQTSIPLARVLSVVDNIESRLKILPFASEFGVRLPDDPEAVKTLECVLDALRRAAGDEPE